MKRLVVCCDGTWNGLSGKYPTNVRKLRDAVQAMDAQGIKQAVFYQEGLGTKWHDRFVGGAFGWGIDENISEVYRFLCLNYAPGDEVYCFGFSRGAYTVRSLIGLIYCSGLLRPSEISRIPEAYRLYRDRNIRPSNPIAEEFRRKFGDRISIKVLGCWDTVGSLGIPDLVPFIPLDQLINRKYQFHDTQLSAIIQNAFHAIAIDERRKSFVATHMEPSDKNPNQVIREVWFPGTHGCVGGGTLANQGLSDGALQWMVQQVSALNLALDPRLSESLLLDPLLSFDTSLGIFRLAGVQDRDIEPTDAWHESVQKRWCDRPDYRPKKLQAALGDKLSKACPA